MSGPATVTPNKQIETPVRAAGRAEQWMCLGIAAALLLIANGRNTVAIAAWLAPVFMLRFTRHARPLMLSLAYVVMFGTWLFEYRGMVPAPTMIVVAVGAGYGLLNLLPFLVDRVVHRRAAAWAATLVFPSAWAFTEYVVSSLTPYGSWGSAAYSQYGNLPLMQLVSVTGLYGITFLLGWFASTVNVAWETGFEWRRTARPALAFAAGLTAVYMAGGLRMSLAPPTAPTVRISSLSRGEFPTSPNKAIAAKFPSNETLTPEEQVALRENARKVNEDLLRRSREEGAAGSKIVFWGEANATVLKPDESALFAEAAEIAKEQGIYVGLGLATWNQATKKPLENKMVLVKPDGNVGFEFWKARPVPGGEMAVSNMQDGRLPAMDTSFGRVGAAICFDMDHPQLLKQAGEQRMDILLAPSNDWRAIDPWHTQMAVFRGVEQGANVVRHVSNGLSVATDYQGRVLASMDHYTTPERTMTAYVPTRGTRTVYSRVGDAFAWMCAAVLAAIIVKRKR